MANINLFQGGEGNGPSMSQQFGQYPNAGYANAPTKLAARHRAQMYKLHASFAPSKDRNLRNYLESIAPTTAIQGTTGSAPGSLVSSTAEMGLTPKSIGLLRIPPLHHLQHLLIRIRPGNGAGMQIRCAARTVTYATGVAIGEYTAANMGTAAVTTTGANATATGAFGTVVTLADGVVVSLIGTLNTTAAGITTDALTGIELGFCIANAPTNPALISRWTGQLDIIAGVSAFDYGDH